MIGTTRSIIRDVRALVRKGFFIFWDDCGLQGREGVQGWYGYVLCLVCGGDAGGGVCGGGGGGEGVGGFAGAGEGRGGGWLLLRGWDQRGLLGFGWMDLARC